MRARLTTDGRESYSDRAPFSLLENVCKTQALQTLGGFVNAVSTAAFGVDDSLGDTIAVEVGEEID